MDRLKQIGWKFMYRVGCVIGNGAAGSDEQIDNFNPASARLVEKNGSFDG